MEIQEVQNGDIISLDKEWMIVVANDSECLDVVRGWMKSHAAAHPGIGPSDTRISLSLLKDAVVKVDYSKLRG